MKDFERMNLPRDEQPPEPECIQCGDCGPWIDEATELCDMCFEQMFGDDEDVMEATFGPAEVQP